MNIKEIREGVKNKHWYYYYNFDGVEVNKKKQKDKTLGFYNWCKIKPIMGGLFSHVDNPSILDIGCNMGLYDHEMTKMGASVVGVDSNIENIEFYKRYVVENKKEDWKVVIKNVDICKEIIINDNINIITMFCVLYHLRPHQDRVMKNIIKGAPNHRFIVLQGNLPRVKKKNQFEAGIDGMTNFLQHYSYSIFKIYEWDGYPKPIVIGERCVGN
jgi:2-polyprenyl-3-methyl-5-hydroxy-6-metoxy-1,4-benzoquinol methylase